MAKKSTEQSRLWMDSRAWTPQQFQLEAWSALEKGMDGLINAPTGSGKTYSLLLPALFEVALKPKAGVRIMWITPIRALAKEIELAAFRVIESCGLKLNVGIRTGDTSQKVRASQRKKMPEVLITTPESLHLMLASKSGQSELKNLLLVAADEWHELMGTKRGVLWELALSRLISLAPDCLVWGISATIGNLDEAKRVLLGGLRAESGMLIRSNIKKQIEVVSILPDEEDRLPWAGHLGTKLVDHVSSIIQASESTLIFTNTRAQCEVWYRTILEANIELAGLVAMHHGSISKELRHWVEDAIADGRLKAVVCTSSLDLGVDFAPVDSIIQIGGPKGVSRFLQRAGRSGHRPDALSKIYFLPTNALELLEAAALRQAISDSFLEDKDPMVRSFDVLIQYLITISLGEGVDIEQTFSEVRQTHCFQSMTREEWDWIIAFVKSGGQALHAYPDYQRWIEHEGRWNIANQRLARRHRMSIGTIVSDTMMSVKFKRGGLIGHIEESFIAGLNEGDPFWFAGMGLKLIQVKELTAYVAKSDSMKGKIPSWQGGRLPLSSKMSVMLRKKMTEAMQGNQAQDPELDAIQTLLSIQNERSLVPDENQFLIESFQSDDGYHAVFYPFEGRFVHEGLASLFAYRMGKMYPLSFSLAYNDYGFELLSDQPIPLEEALGSGLTDALSLEKDLLSGINATELAKRRFRDIATISGLIFKGYPGEPVRDRHLQSSSQLIFKVFEEYDPQNLLLKQAYDEVVHYQLEIKRMRSALDRINSQEIILKYPEKPTPFAFPIMVDRLRERMTTETLSDRIAKMTLDLSE
jgi:ATP-dependent Lhr-like helicase